jgi:hypothetical protein
LIGVTVCSASVREAVVVVCALIAELAVRHHPISTKAHLPRYELTLSITDHTRALTIST